MRPSSRNSASPTEPVIGLLGAGGEVDYGYLLDDDATRRGPTRGRGASRRACTSAREPSTPRRSPGPTSAGPGASSPASVIYELHVGTFTPEGTLDAALEQARPPALDRRRPRRADAGQRVQRHPQLGLRRRAAGSPCTSRTAARRRTSASSTPATPPGSASIQDVVYNHLGPSGNYLPLFGPVPQGRGATPGATWSTSTARARRRCAATSSTTSRMWLRGLPRRRAAARRRARARRRVRRCTCSRRWRSRSPRCRPTCAGR